MGADCNARPCANTRQLTHFSVEIGGGNLVSLRATNIQLLGFWHHPNSSTGGGPSGHKEEYTKKEERRGDEKRRRGGQKSITCHRPLRPT